MMKSGSGRCRAVVASTCARVRIGRCDPVAVTTMSAVARREGTSSHGAARPPTDADRDLADALRAQMLGGEAADLAGADHQYLPAVEAAEDLPRQRDRRKTDRHRAFAKRGLGPYTLADAERPVKELAEHRPCAAASRRRLKRALHLTETLRFANNQRIETGSDAEEMLGGTVVAEREQVRHEAVGRQRMILAEEFDVASASTAAPRSRLEKSSRSRTSTGAVL